MRHSLPIAPQFYVTAPQPCPYLPGQMERKLFTALHGDHADVLNGALSRQGFRRSQNVLYRPSCADCAACLSARIRVADFEPSRSQRRVQRRNGDITSSGLAPWATEEQYALFQRYLSTRHADGGMADMDVFEFAAMIEETQVPTRVYEYRGEKAAGARDGRLMAVCLTDVLEDGLSLVYSFYEPMAAERSLGTHVILDHIEQARVLGLPYVYLGYWVPGSRKMDYKARFAALELYMGGIWRDMAGLDLDSTRTGPLHPSPIHEQVAAIQLPRLKRG